MTKSIDVVVPVYGQEELVLACISSVLEARAANRTPYRLIVVDDASPEPDLIARLKRFPPEDLTLIRHDENLGFVAAANRGMSHSRNDVILMNSDTEAYGDFADRLAAAAYRDPKTATATPFTNFGSIAAYPVPSQPNDLPPGWSAKALDELARRVNPGMTVQIPSGVGFCMYLRRDCLDAVGLFDPAFGRGYGEEVDLCLRAAAAGWNHVLATDVFVWHSGGASFGAERESRLAESRTMLHARWPGFRASVRSATSRDPGKAARHRMTAARMAEDSRPVILRVMHSGSGGVYHHVQDLSALCEPKAESLELVPGPRSHLILRTVLSPAGISLRIRRTSDIDAVVRLLRALGVSRVHVHHLMGHGQPTRDIIERLRVPIDLTLHDYFLLAPQAHLVDNSGSFAGEPEDGSAAESALLMNSESPRPGACLSDWRARWTWLFDNAARVIAQSSDCASRYARYFPRHFELAQPPLTPRLDAPVKPRSPGDGPMRVVVIGALSKEKGADILEGVAQRAHALQFPLEFHLIGYAYRQLDNSVKTHGEYHRSELGAIVSELEPHVAWFPIRWPETWLQTLTLPLELGLPVVVADIGAAPERVSGRDWSWTIPWDSSVSEVCDRLLEIRSALRSNDAPDPVRPPTGPVAPRSGFYPEEYLEPVLRSARPAGALDSQDHATVAGLTPRPLHPAVQVARTTFRRASRKMLRSRFGHVVRRIPPYHLHAVRRLALSDEPDS